MRRNWRPSGPLRQSSRTAVCEEMLQLDQEHPESLNDCLSPDVWKEVMAAAGVTSREMFNAWWLGFLDEASEEELDAIDGELAAASADGESGSE